MVVVIVVVLILVIIEVVVVVVAIDKYKDIGAQYVSQNIGLYVYS